ncbi:MAG: hypothetical protein RLZZ142_2049 [Verrucomicrobiota bacterium]
MSSKPNKTKEDLHRWIETMGDVQNMALLLIASHLENYYEAAVEAAGEDPKTKLRFTLTVDHSGSREHVKVQVSFSRAISDESECWVEDPNQTELPLEKPEKPERPQKTASQMLRLTERAESSNETDEENDEISDRALQLTERAEATDCVDAVIIEEEEE